ncbi:MAG: hypothetical protein JSW27_12325, partial [Phycisphaerales bacterium]
GRFARAGQFERALDRLEAAPELWALLAIRRLRTNNRDGAAGARPIGKGAYTESGRCRPRGKAE